MNTDYLRAVRDDDTSLEGSDAREQLERLLLLHTVGLHIETIRVIGDGGDAAVDIKLDNGITMKFKSLIDMTNGRKINQRINAETGATPDLKNKDAALAVALVRRLASFYDTIQLIVWASTMIETVPYSGK